MRTGLPREIWAHVAVPLTTLKSLLAVGGHVFVSRDTSLGDPRGILFESEGVVYELTVSTGIDRDTVHELLPRFCRGNSWSRMPNTSHTAPDSSPVTPLPLCFSSRHLQVVH